MNAPEWEESGTVRTNSAPVAAPAPAGVPTAHWHVRSALVGALAGALVASIVLGIALVATRHHAASAAVAPLVSGTTAGMPMALTGSSSTPIRALLAKVEPAIVSINTHGIDPNGMFGVEPQDGAGTGMVLTPDGYVLTNNHVIDGAEQIKITFADRSVKDAQLVGRDPENDVALLKVDGVKGLPTADLGVSKDLRVGDPVVAIGNALALPGGPTVTTGIVSAMDRTIQGDSTTLVGLLQTDAAINPGNSGGPLLNSAGQVVGMNTAILRDSNNIGFAIAIDRIKPIVDQLRTGQSAPGGPKTFLGVSTQTMSKQVQEQYGLSTDTGVLVVQVTGGSAAETAGLRSGDVITKLDGTDVANAEQLGNEIRRRKAGDRISLTWLRGTVLHTGPVVLGSARSMVGG